MRSSNKRIAKNTIINYVQMMVSMFVSLISARLVLQVLGASDYGLYGVVGGVISLFTFVSSAMVDTTTRFLNFETGKENGNTNKVFNISIVIHIIVAVFLLIVLETIGLFYIFNYLNVDKGKEDDAMFIFQMSTIVSCIGITNIPYRSLFVAFERFSLIAIVEICNTILKLLLIILLFFYDGNCLRFYTVCMCATTVVSFIAYRFLSKKYWPDIIRKRLVSKIESYKEQLSYNGWSILATFSQMCKNQGSNLLINLFFNTALNAAYSISMTVQASVDVLSSNFSKAATPQITKSIAEGDDTKYLALIYRITRIHLLLMLLTFFTIYIELDFLLDLWLGSNKPSGTLEFCRFSMIMGLVSSTRCGIIHYVRGVGDVNYYYSLMSICFLLGIPIGYVLLSWGYPPYFIIISFIFVDVINRITELIFLKKRFNFDVIAFIKESWTRPALILLVLSVFTFIYQKMHMHSIFANISGIIVTIVISSILCFNIGLFRKEKEIVVSYIRNKFN